MSPFPPVPDSVDSRALRLPHLWWLLTSAAALLAAMAAAVGLLAASHVYERETIQLTDAATAQDIATLLPIAPAMLLVGVAARGGHLWARLCLPGFLAFTAYNSAIYALSVHFGPLFLAWVAVLGLSIFALAGTVATADASAIRARFPQRPMRMQGWFLIVVGSLFVVLWLSEIVPDLLAGNPSSSAADWDVPTNPVHVLDLAFFLPAVITSGILLLRGHRLGHATAAGQLVWLALTCLPILITPLIAHARGHEPGWAVIVPMALMLLATMAVLERLLRAADGPRLEAKHTHPPAADEQT